MAELVDLYTYRVVWSEPDQEFVGLCAEFSLLSHLDPSPEEALKGIREVVAHAVQLNDEDGHPNPDPLSSRQYGGTLTVRVPPETHRQLALDAAEAGVSMNRLAAERLALRR